MAANNDNVPDDIIGTVNTADDDVCLLDGTTEIMKAETEKKHVYQFVH